MNPHNFYAAVAPASRHYGSAWMQSALEARRCADAAGRSSQNELDEYLKSPLERIDPGQIIRWWGVNLRQYISEDALDLSMFPQTNSLRYPTLARMAKDYLAIQGSSVPSERAFSLAGMDSTKRRNALKSDIFEALQILKSAYRNGLLSAQVEAEAFARLLDELEHWDV